MIAWKKHIPNTSLRHVTPRTRNTQRKEKQELQKIPGQSDNMQSDNLRCDHKDE